MNESSPFEVDSIGGSERSDGADTGMKNESNSSDSSDDDHNINTPSLEYNYQYVPIPQSFTADQMDRISVIEEAAFNVQRVLAKYGNASTLPSSLDPNDIITGKLSGWEIDPTSPWSDTSSAINEIVTAGERLVRAWSSSANDDVDSKGSRDDDAQHEPQKKEKEWWWQSILSNDDLQNKSNVSTSESVRRNGGDVVTNGNPPMEEPFTEEEELQFHDVYMEWATNAFGEELDALRKGHLDAFTSARSKTKITSTTTAATTTAVAAMQTKESISSSVELLDPTQYSFVVATGGTKGDNNRKGVNNEADVAATEAARIASIKEIDIRVLSDMLCSGSNVLTVSEKQMLLQARQRAVLKDVVAMQRDDTDATGGLTLHERRKREIGLC